MTTAPVVPTLQQQITGNHPLQAIACRELRKTG
jgi:hypothetical protein